MPSRSNADGNGRRRKAGALRRSLSARTLGQVPNRRGTLIRTRCVFVAGAAVLATVVGLSGLTATERAAAQQAADVETSALQDGHTLDRRRTCRCERGRRLDEAAVGEGVRDGVHLGQLDQRAGCGGGRRGQARFLPGAAASGPLGKESHNVGTRATVVPSRLRLCHEKTYTRAKRAGSPGLLAAGIGIHGSRRGAGPEAAPTSGSGPERQSSVLMIASIRTLPSGVMLISLARSSTAVRPRSSSERNMRRHGSSSRDRPLKRRW